MSGKIRCPQCQTRFALPSEVQENRIWCPGCGTALTRRPAEPADSRITAPPPAPPETGSSRPVSSVAAPRRLQTSSRTAPPDHPPQPTPFDLGEGLAAQNVDSLYSFRRPGRLWPRIVAVVLALGLIGGLFLLVSWMAANQKNRSQPSGIEDDGLPVATSDDQPAAETGEPGPSPETASARPAKDRSAKAPPPVRPVVGKPEYFSQRDWEQAWQRINGYLVKLDIVTPAGSRQATGLIVDSRGWVATSLSALKNAGRVSVTGAAKRLDNDPPWQTLTDEARGIIATDPQHDLAIIAINRSQVINLSDPRLATEDRLVPAHRMLIARTPPPNHSPWLTECRIDRRAAWSGLDETSQQVIERNGLDQQDAFQWVLFTPRAQSGIPEQVAGSPLLDLEGRIMALNTGFSANGDVLAVPATAVVKLLASIGPAPPVQPFSAAGQLSQSSPAGPDSQQTGGPAGDDFNGLTERIATAFRLCRETDWSADNAGEYRTFQDLARDLVAARNWLENRPMTDDEFATRETWFQEQMDAIVMSMSDDIDIDEFETGKSNQWFAESVNRDHPWCVLSVTVHKDAIMTGNIGDRPACTLKVLGTNEIVLAPLHVDGREFRQGREFLIFGELETGATGRIRNADNSQMTRVVRVHVSFWINEK